MDWIGLGKRIFRKLDGLDWIEWDDRDISCILFDQQSLQNSLQRFLQITKICELLTFKGLTMITIITFVTCLIHHIVYELDLIPDIYE